MENKEAPPIARVVAAEKIVDRAEGRAIQATVDLTPPRDDRPLPVNLDKLTDEQRAAFAEVLLLTADVEPGVVVEGDAEPTG